MRDFGVGSGFGDEPVQLGGAGRMLEQRKRVGVATLNTYEGLFIFADTLKDEELTAVMDRVEGEVVRQGGSILGSKKLGRRSFARAVATHLRPQ